MAWFAIHAVREGELIAQADVAGLGLRDDDNEVDWIYLHLPWCFRAWQFNAMRDYYWRGWGRRILYWRVDHGRHSFFSAGYRGRT